MKPEKSGQRICSHLVAERVESLAPLTRGQGDGPPCAMGWEVRLFRIADKPAGFVAGRVRNRLISFKLLENRQ
jgi:hypothetical protein